MLTFLALGFFGFEYPFISVILIGLAPDSLLCFDLGHIGSTVVCLVVVYVCNCRQLLIRFSASFDLFFTRSNLWLFFQTVSFFFLGTNAFAMPMVQCTNDSASEASELVSDGNFCVLLFGIV